MKTVLAAIDFSPVTDPVLGVVAGLARALEARVVLLHVVPSPPPLSAYQISDDEAAQLVAATEKDAARRLGNLAGRLAGVATETLTATGVPADEIVREALGNRADFIVVGSHGHTALYDLLVGSTTHGVLKKAACPVLIVPSAIVAAASKPASEAADKLAAVGR
ncbi:MAG TPA: universal stress protein [Opitutaceae bacterium]|nr:universal stress protein [Opitutaceae bacterium]